MLLVELHMNLKIININLKQDCIIQVFFYIFVMIKLKIKILIILLKLGGTGTGPDPFDFITYDKIDKVLLGHETTNKMFD